MCGATPRAVRRQHSQGDGPVLVHMFASLRKGMAVRLRRRAAEGVGSIEASIEEWPYLDEGVLLKTRSRKVCMTCHWMLL